MNTTNNNNQSWVTVRRFTTPVEAHVARTALENEGIEAFVRDEHMIGANPLYSNALGGVRLDVREADLARAAEVLGPEGAPSGRPCPECGGESEPFAGPVRKASAVLTFLLASVPLPFVKEGRKCRSCGHSWRG